MNIRTKQVEMRTSKFTEDGGSALQKGADFLRAFTLGFDVDVLPPTALSLNLGCDIASPAGRFVYRDFFNPRCQTFFAWPAFITGHRSSGRTQRTDKIYC